jgi:long-chain acyl-CoA synthetase
VADNFNDFGSHSQSGEQCSSSRAACAATGRFWVSSMAGEWRTISWAETARRVAGLAKSLKAMGLKKGDRVMLVSENRPEWCIADLGIMAAGCVTVPTYTTNTERDHQHILDNSQSRAVIVSTAKLAQASDACRGALVRMRICDRHGAAEGPRNGPARASRLGRSGAGHRCRCRGAHGRNGHVGRDDLACIIYTSGTGGAPRGVMLHHGSILCNVDGAAQVIARGFRAGTTNASSRSCRSATPMNIRADSFCPSGWRGNLLFRRAGKAGLQHRGNPADDHGRRPAPV